MALTLGILLLGMLLGLLLEWIVVRFFMPDTKLERESLVTSLQARKADNAALQQQVQQLQAELVSAREQAAQQLLVNQQQAEQQLATARTECQVQLAALQAQLAAIPAPPVVQPPMPVQAPSVSPIPPVQLELATATLPVMEDLTRLSGIGPKLAEAMQTAGIYNYAQLQAMTADEIVNRLSGVRYNKNLLESWPKQASFAMQSDWDGLKQYQAALK